LEKDDWFWVMVVLSVLRSVIFLSVIALCTVTYPSKRRYLKGDQQFDEFS